ncbi:hypothetical protein E4T56_gene2807 [Termitomyces sp. T112]|nr:hypothetical protein E4T56_gene2807 [Termitomyces sp. T112]
MTCRAKACECAAVHACHAEHFPYADLDLLSSPPLAFPHREAFYKNVQGVGCQPLEEEEGKEEWTSTADPESPAGTIEVGNKIYATTLGPPPTVAEILASHTTSQHLAEDFEDIFSKASFDSLPEHKQWDHAIELIPNAEPSSCKVYLLVPLEWNYEIYDKEMLAIIWSFKEWQHFLEGAEDNDNIVLLKPELFATHALEGIVVQEDEANILRNIRRGNQEGAQEDVVAQAAQALQA